MKTKAQKIRYSREQVFADLLTSQGKKFLYQSAVFHVNGIQYRPDFYIPKERIFYEVVGTRQAFNQNRQKIKIVQGAYPFLKIIAVNPDGTPYRASEIRKPIEHTGPSIKRFSQDWDIERYRGLDVERRRQFLSREKLFSMTGISSDQQQRMNFQHNAPKEAIHILARALKRSPEFVRFLIEKYPTIQQISEYESRQNIHQKEMTLFDKVE